MNMLTDREIRNMTDRELEVFYAMCEDEEQEEEIEEQEEEILCASCGENRADVVEHYKNDNGVIRYEELCFDCRKRDIENHDGIRHYRRVFRIFKTEKIKNNII